MHIIIIIDDEHQAHAAKTKWARERLFTYLLAPPHGRWESVRARECSHRDWETQSAKRKTEERGRKERQSNDNKWLILIIFLGRLQRMHWLPHHRVFSGKSKDTSSSNTSECSMKCTHTKARTRTRGRARWRDHTQTQETIVRKESGESQVGRGTKWRRWRQTLKRFEWKIRRSKCMKWKMPQNKVKQKSENIARHFSFVVIFLFTSAESNFFPPLLSAAFVVCSSFFNIFAGRLILFHKHVYYDVFARLLDVFRAENKTKNVWRKRWRKKRQKPTDNEKFYFLRLLAFVFFLHDIFIRLFAAWCAAALFLPFHTISSVCVFVCRRSQVRIG